jgi:hypothetical protein
MRKLVTNLQLHVPSHEKRRKRNGECQSSAYQDNTTLICCSYDGNRSRLAWQQSRRVRIHDVEIKDRSLICASKSVISVREEGDVRNRKTEWSLKGSSNSEYFVITLRRGCSCISKPPRLRRCRFGMDGDSLVP